MKELVKKFTSYINENLSVHVSAKKWNASGKLSILLKDLYEYYICKLLDQECLLMIPASNEDLTPAKIRKHIDQINDKHHLPVIYLASAVSPFQRKRLIQQGVPFVIPGNQMYLPLFGLDLRDYYKKSRMNRVKNLSPSSQAVLLHILYQQKQNEFTVSGLAKVSGYSSMTIVRVFDELQSLGLADTRIEGRKRIIWLSRQPIKIWDEVKSLLTSPVKKRVFLESIPTGWKARKAGFSALSAYTMISQPAVPVFAVSSAEWKKLKKHNAVKEIPIPEAGGCEIEIWSYNPDSFSQNEVVDTLSLSLTLQEKADERIESAIAELREAFPW